MQILYISSVPSFEEFNRMKKYIREGVNITTYGMNEAGFKFHTLIQEGLLRDPSVNIVSLIGRSTSFRTYKGVLWRLRKESRDNIEYIHPGYINIPFLKQLILGVSFFFHTLRWLRKHKNEQDKFIIMDAAYITVIPFVVLAEKIIKCKTLAVFCDIYAYMADVKDARESSGALYRLIGRFMKSIYRNLDSMVFLTEKMNEVINPKSKPYLIIEGLVDINMAESDNRIENKTEQDAVMYAGALREQYGLKNLVEGFTNYRNENARLWIYGAGDYSEEIKAAAIADHRIQFFGQSPLHEVVNKELEATLLINPRPASREFTQYSFPSKNMEYMASGTPLLTTRLPGMPYEYYDYVFTIDGDDAQSVTAALEKVFAFSKSELHDKGSLSKKFVLEKKNNIVQANRITGLLKKL